MRNKRLILVAIFVMILLGLAIFLVLKNKQNTPTSVNLSTSDSKGVASSDIVPLVSDATEGTPIGSKIALPTNDSKGTVSANNYYIAPSARVIDSKDVVIDANKNFDILGYNYNNERTFLIYLKSSFESLTITRLNAENSFIEKLGITKEQACLLSVSERVSPDVPGSTTEDYGLSFCPNNKSLPASN